MVKQYGLHLEKRKMFSLFDSIEYEKSADKEDPQYLLGGGIRYVAGSIISAYMEGFIFIKIKYLFKMGFISGLLKYFVSKRIYNKHILKDCVKCEQWLSYNIDHDKLNHLANIACDLDGLDSKKKVVAGKASQEVERGI
jgi:hypothetical protein